MPSLHRWTLRTFRILRGIATTLKLLADIILTVH